MLPLLRLGRVAEAMEHQQRGYRLIARNRTFLRQVAEHIQFLVLTDNRAPAAKLLEKHLSWALESADLSRRFDFYLAVDLLLSRLLETGKEKIKLRLPRAFPAYEEEGEYEVAALAAWFRKELEELARRFDARNGNNYFRRRIKENGKLKKLLRPCPLPKKGAKA